MLVNQKELAAILGVTDRRIRQLRNDFGLFEKCLSQESKKKNYVLEKCIQEYINYKIEAEVQGGTKEKYDKEREQAEHEAIKKKISILKLRKLRRELHEASDVEEYLTSMLIEFRNRILAVPAKVSPLVLGEDDINQVIKIIEKEMYEILSTLSEYDPDKIDKQETASSILEDEEGDC